MTRKKSAEAEADKDYVFTGKITLDGAIFYITAKSLDEAQARADAGDWDDYDVSGASSSDWEINSSSGELNA